MLPSSSLRPLWLLNGETRLWSLPARRAGPSSGVLISLMREADEWAVVDQARRGRYLPLRTLHAVTCCCVVDQARHARLAPRHRRQY